MMDSFLDRVWEVIYTFLTKSVVFLDNLFSPLEILGPGFVIFFLAFLIVLITRIIGRFYVTKRYITLKKEFEHWQGIREEAMKHPDREKGKRLARNIDKAELNKVYYDYFFEGLLKNFITNVIPILFMVTYVTTVYTPETLLKRFGEKWVFSFSFGTSLQINMSSLFWFIICIILSFILFVILKTLFKKYDANKKKV
jgi:Na+-transporting methylmalonyl-CoA/oxaloacetate decarboxylase gamma subunit